MTSRHGSTEVKLVDHLTEDVTSPSSSNQAQSACYLSTAANSFVEPSILQETAAATTASTTAGTTAGTASAVKPLASIKPVANGHVSSSKSSATKKRVVRITKERRRKLKKQPSLVELTAHWFVARLTSLFGDQLDNSLTYFLALVVLVACVAVALGISPVHMMALVALGSFIAFYMLLP